MRSRRLPTLVVTLVLALGISGTAVAFDCIRVSSSLQGLIQSTKSGNWLLFNFGSASGVQQTFSNVFGQQISASDAQCLATNYAASGQPRFFALGVGVAGGKKPATNSQGARAAAGGFGVIAWNNPNIKVLSDGRGIDHLEVSGIFGAAAAAAQACGVELPA